MHWRLAAMQITPSSVLYQVANSLVAQQRYSSLDDALWDIALSAIRNKTLVYRRRIKKLENKHAMNFEKFTAHLKNRATPAEEDDWLAWRSAQNMLGDWEKAYQDLIHAHRQFGIG
jgi:hypothetical protein